MCLYATHCYKLVMFYFRKLYKWFIKKIIKVNYKSELLCFFLVLVFVSCYLSWNQNDITSKQPSENPVLLWWTEGFPGSSDTKHCSDDIKCDVYSSRSMCDEKKVQAYLFYGSNINFSDVPERKPADLIWGLSHEESPRNVEELMHEPVLNLFNFSSTYSRYSDVPYPLQYLESFNDITSSDYYVETAKKNSYLNELAPILYIQSDCETSTERDIYVEELMKFTKIDSYGACVNNKKLQEKFTHDYLNKLNEDEFLRFVARYKFVIAIENGVCEDYVTEKLWRAIRVGSVPIYFGSPSVEDWLPNKKSAILLEDFPTPTVLTEHLNKLLKDDNLYEEYLEHKIQQIVTNERLIREYNERPYQFDSLETIEQFECFICKMVHRRINEDFTENVVTKRHYDCPKPVSALTLGINSANSWVQSWEYKKVEAEKIYKRIMNVI